MTTPPQGDNYFYWETGANQTEHYTEISSDTTPSGGWPITLTMGETYYLAFYAGFDRLDGTDIWHEGNATQSADIGIKVKGADIRVLACRGQWEHMVANEDHHYTTYTGVMSGDNPSTTFGHNQNGYTTDNPYNNYIYGNWIHDTQGGINLNFN
jgi:hypothetical protein